MAEFARSFKRAKTMLLSGKRLQDVDIPEEQWVLRLILNRMVHGSASLARDVGAVAGYEAMQLSKIMSSSKGRDKICALIQYSVELYVNCMKYSLEYGDLVE